MPGGVPGSPPLITLFQQSHRNQTKTEQAPVTPSRQGSGGYKYIITTFDPALSFTLSLPVAIISWEIKWAVNDYCVDKKCHSDEYCFRSGHCE